MAVVLATELAARLPEGFQEFLDRLIAEFDPERVILFGSRARGEATDDSDTDVLVVMDCPGKPLRMAQHIRLALQAQFPLDLLVMTPERFAAQLNSPGYDFADVVQEQGVCLWLRT